MTHTGMYVLTWINDGVSANAAYVSDSVEKLKELVKQEWDVEIKIYDAPIQETLDEIVDCGDGTIVFRFDNPATQVNEIFAQIELATKI